MLYFSTVFLAEVQVIEFFIIAVFCRVVSHSVVSDSVTPWTVACQAPLSMGVLQARILECVAMPSSRGSFQPRDRTQVLHIADEFFTTWVMTVFYLCVNSFICVRTTSSIPLLVVLITISLVCFPFIFLNLNTLCCMD